MRTIAISLLFSLSLLHAQTIRTGEDVLRAMHDRYPKWYHTVTFTQKSTTYKPDGTSSAETWYEALTLPGKLRIDIGPASDGKGMMMVDGELSMIRDNKVTETRHYVNMLLVLGFDVYGQDPSKTANVVKGEGFDLSKVHEDVWEGKPVYVVGGDKGDLNSKQFWVMKDSLLFVRVMTPTRADPTKLNDIRFTKYQPLAGGWIAAGVEVHSEGRKVFTEDYSDIQANVKLDPAIYDPQQFASTHWEK